MAFVIADRVRETSTTTGTGNFTLAGAVTGYQTFDAALDTGDTTYYAIADQGGANWEVGIGTFTSPSTLARTTILSSSNGGSVVTFTSGTKDVFISLPSSKTNVEDQPNLIEVNSSSAALRITQTGTGNALVVEDSANPDATPFMVDASGNVGIGTSSPAGKLDILTGTYRGYFDDSGGGLFRLNGVLANNSAYGPMGLNGSVVLFQTGGIERARIDSSGNVGIGTSSPGNAKLNTQGFGSYRGNAYTIASFAANSTLAPLNIVQATDGTIPGISAGQNSSAVFSSLGFYTSEAERMRIDSSGNLLVGTSSTLFASSHAFVNSGTAVLGLRNSLSTAGKYWKVGPDFNSSFLVYNQSNVGMFLSDGSTSWASSSDERQKNIIEPISDAANKVASLRAVIGSYKNDETNKRRSFLIAQDVQQVLPEAVTEAPDGFLGVAYSDVIPLLVAAIQELKADNDAMKERIATLEAK